MRCRRAKKKSSARSMKAFDLAADGGRAGADLYFERTDNPPPADPEVEKSRRNFEVTMRVLRGFDLPNNQYSTLVNGLLAGAVVGLKGPHYRLESGRDQLDNVQNELLAVHYGFMTSVAHHEWEQAAKNSIVKTLPVSDGNDRALLFEAALSAFEDVLVRALQRRLDVHAEIDAFISEGQSGAATLRRLLAVNFDARRYFFTIAPEHLLDWLRDNAFLQPVWEVPESQTNLSYYTPELDYLVKVAATQSQKVVDIMLSVAISADHFNPEVLDRFLWICQSIPADQLTRIRARTRG
jgi:hypothetical protein